MTPWPARPYDGTDSDVTSSDDGLMRTLYAQYSAPLLHFALRMVGDRQRAEDIVQETLLRAWRNADRLRLEDGASLRPWLVTVARRIAIDEHRSRAARPAETYDVEPEVAVPDETDHLVQRLAVTQALKELSPPHREILLETYYRGRTVPEAARSLGLPLGTAKSRVYYALHALRGALDRRGVT
jgi:RNA polymerase sigma-70 factor (ECF subfamily)